MTDQSAPSVNRRLLEIAALALLYFAAGRLGQLLAIPPGNVTAVWAPSGIALAAVLLRGSRVWPGIWLGSFFGNTWAFFDPTSLSSLATSVAVGASIGMGATLEALAGAYLLAHFGATRHFLDRAQEFFKFVVLGGALSCTISASVGVSSLLLGGFVLVGDYPVTWWTWWLGDTIGVLIVTPFAMAWSNEPSLRWKPWRLLEAGVLGTLMLATTALIFGGWAPLSTEHYPVAHIVLPFLVWGAFRFGQRGATSLILLASGIGIWGTIHGFGPFIQASLNESLLMLQGYMGVGVVTILAMTAVIAERGHAERDVRASEERFRLAFEEAPIGMAIVSLDYRLLRVNKTLCKMLGYTEQELTARTFVDITHPEDVEKDVQLAQQVFTGRIPHYELEKRYIKKSGDSLPIKLTAAVVRDPEGRPLYGLGMIEDIAERKLAEQAREALLQQLQDALQKVKTLRGLLPICALCNKVRDDQGNWRPLETYVEEHTLAEFSHGICPDCSLPRPRVSLDS